MVTVLARTRLDGELYIAARAPAARTWSVAPEVEVVGAGRDWMADPFAAVTEAHGHREVSDLETSLLLPLPQRGRVVCVQANNHAASRMIARFPEQPLFVLKSFDSLVPSGEDLSLPTQAAPAFPEAEFAIVLGEDLEGVTAERAWQAVRGVLVVNDVTLEGFARLDGFVLTRADGEQVTRASTGRSKSWLRGTPVSSTALFGHANEVEDLLGGASLDCSIDGELVQRGSVRDYFWQPPVILSYLSHCLALRRGDLV